MVNFWFVALFLLACAAPAGILGAIAGLTARERYIIGLGLLAVIGIPALAVNSRLQAVVLAEDAARTVEDLVDVSVDGLLAFLTFVAVLVVVSSGFLIGLIVGFHNRPAQEASDA